MEAIKFLVQGSSSVPYEVIFSRCNNEVTALCSCPAGVRGTYCKHRLDIFDGVLDGIVSGNADQVRDVVSWLPGSRLGTCLTELALAAQAVKDAKHLEEQARKKLAAMMSGGTRKAAAQDLDRPELQGGIQTALVLEAPQRESGRRLRVPLTSIRFTDFKAGVGGYATGWYFWVHSAFQEALDIIAVAPVDKVRTAALREMKSVELFGMTHEELKRKIKAEGQLLASSKEHQQLMAITVTGASRLMESTFPNYEFQVTDGFESRNGEWYVQVDQTAATDGAPGSIGFRLYSRNHSPRDGEGVWSRKTWMSTTQRDFVALLQSGRCLVIDLENPPVFQEVQEGQSTHNCPVVASA